MLLELAPATNEHLAFVFGDVRLPQRVLVASFRKLIEEIRDVSMVLVHDGSDVEAGLQEVGMSLCFFLGEHGEVGQRARSESEKDLAEQVTR
jgi:hypothetical protein